MKSPFVFVWKQHWLMNGMHQEITLDQPAAGQTPAFMKQAGVPAQTSNEKQQLKKAVNMQPTFSLFQAGAEIYLSAPDDLFCSRTSRPGALPTAYPCSSSSADRADLRYRRTPEILSITIQCR